MDWIGTFAWDIAIMAMGFFFGFRWGRAFYGPPPTVPPQTCDLCGKYDPRPRVIAGSWQCRPCARWRRVVIREPADA